MKKIFYLGYYDTPDNKSEKRNIVLAATNKMTYIVSALEDCGYSVNLISASNTRSTKKCPAKNVKIGKQSQLYLPKALPWGNKLRRMVSVYYSKYRLFKDLLKFLSKGDTLIVYHSVAYASIVRAVKKIRKIKLVLEVEEIYGDVSENEKISKKEIKFFKIADGYVFSNDLLNKKVNPKNKPHIVIYGTYKNETKLSEHFNDGKKHVVYAGTFDMQKGGAAYAISAAEFLDENYHVHIIGFGSKEDKEKLLRNIEETSKKTKCAITYDGLLSGNDYLSFLQKCHIGLSTQNAGGKFNDTSFPSKILSYMANGLRVVSARIPVVEKSEIGEYMQYYLSQTPQEIAKAIKSVNLDDEYNSRKKVAELDEQFKIGIGGILGA